jgi:Uncharacterized conserved protein
MDKIDYKKLNKELYSPKGNPSIIQVPAMKFIMVDGFGNPNDTNGEYSEAVSLLYALTFTIKMGLKFNKIKLNDDTFVDYTVPPLEGFWWLEDDQDMNFTQKEKFCWTSFIRQPDFITEDIFLQAKEEVQKKKPESDVTKARFEEFEEGLCVQCMHIGPFDLEPATITKINNFISENGYTHDISGHTPDGHIRRHHEIYLSDPRKADLAKMRTIIRHPVK